MSEEKECKCCHEWWYASDIKQDLCPNCYDYFKQLKQQLAETEQRFLEFQEDSIRNEQIYVRELAEKDKEIERLKVFEKAYYFNLSPVSKEYIKLMLQNAYQTPNQTQLAIQELEKVKEEFGLKSGWSSETDMCFDLEQFIKQQIKELKGE